MGTITKPDKARSFLLLFILLGSIVFTGCEKGSLGIKGGIIQGYVLDSTSNNPIAEVLVRANHGGVAQNTLTGGDGLYVFTELNAQDYLLSVEKYGYASMTLSEAVMVQNGQTVIAPVIRLDKTLNLSKGTLKGYPVDGVTGRPLQNFTVVQTYPETQLRSKLFDTAQEFRDTGWTSLEGGQHRYKITCENYIDYTTGNDDAGLITISKTAHDLGVISMQPLTVTIAGTLRNLPGHVISGIGDTVNPVIWAEAAGKVVATGTTNEFSGTVQYNLTNVPVTAGSVAVKCKLRGYDIVTINSAVSVPKQLPGGVIGSIDCDFKNVDPIRRDLRVVVYGDEPSDDMSSFEHGETARIYIQQGGKDIVPYVDVVSQNYQAEGYFSGIYTGYKVNIIVVNQTRGYITGELNDVEIPEDGNTAMTIKVPLG